MIEKLDLSNDDLVGQLLELQTAAYQVEAELIGFDGIPALRDTVQKLQNCGETFYGSFLETELIGAVSYTRSESLLEICRLVVSPLHFKKGIGGRLLQTVLEAEPGIREYRVFTGAKNNPALRLYQKLGFREAKQVEVEKGVFLSQLEKQAELRETRDSFSHITLPD